MKKASPTGTAPKTRSDLPASMGRLLGRVARLTRLRSGQPHRPVDPRPVEELVGELVRLLDDKSDDRDGLRRDPAFWSLVHALYAKRPRVGRRTGPKGDGAQTAGDDDHADESEASEAGAEEPSEAAEAGAGEEPAAAEDNGASSADEVASAIGTEWEPDDDEEPSADVENSDGGEAPEEER